MSKYFKRDSYGDFCARIKLNYRYVNLFVGDLTLHLLAQSQVLIAYYGLLLILVNK